MKCCTCASMITGQRVAGRFCSCNCRDAILRPAHPVNVQTFDIREGQ